MLAYPAGIDSARLAEIQARSKPAWKEWLIRQGQIGRVLEFEGWGPWLKTIFPRYASAEFSDYQVEYWEWLWSVDTNIRPEPFVAIWPRGGAKSTSTELGCVAVAARRKRRYVLYVCMTQEQA